MVSLTEALYKDLTEGQAAYSTAFRQSFDISYVTTVGSVLHKHLASATNDLMTRMNGILYKQSGIGIFSEMIQPKHPEAILTNVLVIL